ncbi:unnamed protein product [Caenorhabditis sp. 36 PRJEB53466]|nr:unnamed protein product [Caenorhabditis sp. 36 PRJEB53466]
MDQWSQRSSGGPPNQMVSHLMSLDQPPNCNSGCPKDEAQYVMRQVTDTVRYAMCDAIAQRPSLWDPSREKVTTEGRKSLFGEVADLLNQQFVLQPPITIEEIEKHWKNLKDTFVKTRRKLTYDQQGCLIPPKWKFFNALMFLEVPINPEYLMKKRMHVTPILPHPQQSQPYEMYTGPASKKEKIDDSPPSDEFMEFCRSLYLPLKEVGYKDRVHWLKIQKAIRDIVYEAQLESVTKGPPDMR